MIRRCLTAMGAMFLVLPFVQAPYAHLHPQDLQHRHATGLMHTHGIGCDHAEPGTPEIESFERNESTLWLEWLPTPEKRAAVQYPETVVPFAVEPEPALIGLAPEFIVRAHSPPELRLLSARSPPV